MVKDSYKERYRHLQEVRHIAWMLKCKGVELQVSDTRVSLGSVLEKVKGEADKGIRLLWLRHFHKLLPNLLMKATGKTFGFLWNWISNVLGR